MLGREAVLVWELVPACARRKDLARFSLRKGSSGRVEWPAAPKLFPKELGNAAGRQMACEVQQRWRRDGRRGEGDAALLLYCD